MYHDKSFDMIDAHCFSICGLYYIIIYNYILLLFIIIFSSFVIIIYYYKGCGKKGVHDSHSQQAMDYVRPSG